MAPPETWGDFGAPPPPLRSGRQLVCPGLTRGVCRTIVVKKEKCVVISGFTRGRLQSVSRGLQRLRVRSLRGKAPLSCAEVQRAGQFFRIWPDATISIARITDSDVAGGVTGHPETELRT
jgi:hypothetical protein